MLRNSERDVGMAQHGPRQRENNLLTRSIKVALRPKPRVEDPGLSRDGAGRPPVSPRLFHEDRFHEDQVIALYRYRELSPAPRKKAG